MLLRRHDGAQDGHFPAFIDADTLQKCGYFDSHPNAVTFVGNVIEDFDENPTSRWIARGSKFTTVEYDQGGQPERIYPAVADVPGFPQALFGRSLDKLFKADRASIQTELTVKTVKEFQTVIRQLLVLRLSAGFAFAPNLVVGQKPPPAGG